ncbi:MAG: pyrimidine dimer DNA glycosylase/endonuclease V [Dehalococcoidia bacterium]
MVNPKYMCDRHLLGEHVECHMFAGCLTRGKSLTGYINKDLFDPSSLVKRHDQLAREMISRGFHHRSPLSGCAGEPSPIDAAQSLNDLVLRCDRCRKRYESHLNVVGRR